MPKNNNATLELVSEAMDFAFKINGIIKKDNRYDPEAYAFTMSALHYTLSGLKKHKHINGIEFLEGIRRYAIEQYGPMVRTVFEHWGIKTTEDFGEIVFNLIETGLMKKTNEDTKENFKNIYNFKSAFDRPYKRSVCPKILKMKRQEKQ